MVISFTPFSVSTLTTANPLLPIEKPTVSPRTTAPLIKVNTDFLLKVEFPDDLLQKFPENKRDAAIGVLSHDPRPSYQRKPDRVYGLTFAGFDIRFKVNEDILIVQEVSKV
jgi:hypothetical protein